MILLKQSLLLLGGLLVVGTIHPLGIASVAPPEDRAPWLQFLTPAPLVDTVSRLIQNSVPVGDLATHDPDLAIITYRGADGAVADLVVQLYKDRKAEAVHLINPHGVVRDRVGDSMADSADRFLSLVSQPGQFLGGQTEVRRRQRAFALIFNGDLSLLREETVEPLQVIGILPHAERYLPASLRSRVQTVVFNSELRFGEWRTKIRFVTEDPDSAVQVGNIVAAWRDLAGSLADRFAGYSSGQRLREALQTATVQVSGDEVTAAGIIPAAAVVRVAKEAAGHGGGCPPGTPCALNKVAICHLTSSGHGGHTICVTPSAVSAHLAHGDTCGPCAEEAATVEPDPSSSR